MDRPNAPPRIIYSGDRNISVEVLRFLLDQGCRPLALLVPDEKRATHARELIALCDFLSPDHILVGDRFRSEEGIRFLASLKPDYILGIHFPYIVPKAVLEVPTQGVLNLHPAFLPFNRGWHTPSWAILDGTPYGATLHFMDEGVDTGDIVHQRQVEVAASDTADSLYQKVLRLEAEVFREAWPSLASLRYKRTPQSAGAGTAHVKKDLSAAQRLDLDAPVPPRDLLRRLRALTTNSVKEAVTFVDGGKMFRVQVKIVEEPTP